MNNASSVVLRTAGLCLHSSSWLTPGSILRITPSQVARLSTLSQSTTRSLLQRSPVKIVRQLNQPSHQSFHQSFVLRALKAYNAKEERGLSFSKTALSKNELYDIFQHDSPPTNVANHLLRIIHARRVDGTLDIELPHELQRQLQNYPRAFDLGLEWLRQNYPVDEDAAIIARIEREDAQQEKENPAELMQRGEDLGLYAPQSGRYRAQLSEKEGDLYGRSELDRIRAENEAKAEQEEKELEDQINQITAKHQEQQQQKSEQLATRPDQSLEVGQEIRLPNSFDRWVLQAKNRAQSKLTLNSPEVVNRGRFSRLAPSFLFTVFVVGGAYIYSQWWAPPRQAERLYPDASLTFTTIAGILGVNVCVFLLWRIPPAWAFLNKYFIVTPAHPRPFALLGNIFSHQSLTHLFWNSVGLVLFTTRLHEDIGRGTFMSIYVASGVVGSFLSLTSYTLRGAWMVSSLGASGAVSGILAAWCCLHAHDTFQILFIPPDFLSPKGWHLLAFTFVVELWGITRAVRAIDYISHMGGLLTGTLAIEWWKWGEGRPSLIPESWKPQWWKDLGKRR